MRAETSHPIARALVSTSRTSRAITIFFSVCWFGFISGCDRADSVQSGHRGTGMLQVYDPGYAAQAIEKNGIPEAEPVDEAEPDTPMVGEVHKNVQVLTDLNVLEFSRLMQAMSTWVAPEEGCEYCHNPNNLASDEKYAKVVARRMLQMTRDINTQWTQHVAGTGVTCWTCHRGQAVPSGDWFKHPGENLAMKNMMGNRAEQNTAGVATVANSSLPYDPLSTYLNTEAPSIRVQGTTALATGNRQSVRQAEFSYGLMIYMSQSLGVNCTFCHNTRSLASWETSSPQRVTAWYGIRMVRALNVDYLNPIAPLLPAHRLSAEGDGPKVGCQTCHKGTYKPLFGKSMLGDHPELRGPLVRPPLPAASAAGSVALR
jgi:photosynthetic reaction center cytochrome c subunit